MKKIYKTVSFVLVFCLLSVISICTVFAYDASSISVSLASETASEGKVDLKLTINAPRAVGTSFGFTFTMSSSAEGVYLDTTDSRLTSDGKTTAAHKVFLPESTYKDTTTASGVRAYWQVGKGTGTNVRVYIFSDFDSDSVTITIPLAIPDTVTEAFNVAATPKSGSAETYYDEGNGPTAIEITEEQFVTTTTVTFSSGEGDSTPAEIPAEDITNSTGGAATVTSSIADGTATLNVASQKACVVAYTTDGGATYTRLTATAADSGYNFSVAYTEGMQFAVAVKGDVSGDAAIDASDFGALVAAYLGTGTLDALNTVIGDVDGNGVIDANDFGALVAAYLGTGTVSW